MKKINEILSEEVNRLFKYETYDVTALSKVLINAMYGEENNDGAEFIYKKLLKSFEDNGDKGVTDAFIDMSGVKIETLTKGEYIFANLVEPNKLKDTDWNINENLLKEEVENNILYGYHVTPCSNVKSIARKGFNIGDRQMQGKGVYGFYNLEGTKAATGYGSRHIGDEFCVVKFKITNPDYLLILNNVIAKDVLGNRADIFTQINNAFGGWGSYWGKISSNLRPQYKTNEYMEEVRAEISKNFADNHSRELMFGTANLEQLNLYGIVFDGEYGQEFLIKQPNLMIPIGYHTVRRTHNGMETSELIALDEENSGDVSTQIKNLIDSDDRYESIRDIAHRLTSIDDIKMMRFNYKKHLDTVRNNNTYDKFNNIITIFDELIDKFE